MATNDGRQRGEKKAAKNPEVVPKKGRNYHQYFLRALYCQEELLGQNPGVHAALVKGPAIVLRETGTPPIIFLFQAAKEANTKFVLAGSARPYRFG